jgi:hypothetical protein
MIQEERSIFWKVIVSIILSKKVYMYRQATGHVLTRVAKCIAVMVQISKMYYTR